MNDRRRRFEAQVLPHLDAAYRYARWLARSPDGADDLVQDAVLRAYRGYEALRGADAKAWLMTIVRNCHFTTRKKAQSAAWVPLPEEHDAAGHVLVATTPDPETVAVLRDEARELDRLLAELPDDYREVLILRELEEMTYSQIASVTRMPIGTVMSRLSRARAALRERWQRQAPGGTRALS